MQCISLLVLCCDVVTGWDGVEVNHTLNMAELRMEGNTWKSMKGTTCWNFGQFCPCCEPYHIH